MDATKAFDSVWRDGLFYKVKDRLPDNYWYLLKNYYDSSISCLELNGMTSDEHFKVSRGVKQGEILSPALFNIFVDDFLQSIVSENLGLRIKDINLSIMAYCDDIILMSHSFQELQTLVNISGKFGEAWNIKLNPSKSCVFQTGKNYITISNSVLK